MWELTQFIAKDYCLSCQGCCRFPQQESIWQPHLLEEEIARIAPFSKKVELVAGPGQGNYICQFLNAKENKCKVYTIRPFECRLYPFLINRRGRKVYLSVDLKCPFIKKAAALQEYKDYAHYVSEFFNNQSILSALKKNPQLIQTYEEVLDIFELKL